MTMTRRRLLDDTFKKTVEGNPAIATDSLARMYPGIVMQGWTTQDGTPTPEAPVPIVSAGTQNQETGKWEYEITIANAQTDPDKNQTVTLTADRPLTKWDRLEKRNGQWGWVYGSAEMTFDGSADEEWLLYSNPTYLGFQISVSDLKEGSRIEGFCDSFPVEIAVSGTDPAIWMIDKTLYFKNVNPKYASNAEEWKTWLQSNNIKILYQTAAETFVPLAAAEQEAMNALHTYRPTTVLSNQQDCEMALTYKTRKGVGGGGNLLDLDDPSFALMNCIYVSKYSVKCNIADYYFSNISNYNLNDLIKRNIGKNIIFSCDGNPEGRRIGIVLYGSYLDGSTVKEINTAAGKEIKLKIEDATEFTRIDLRFNRSSEKITDTETIISNLSLKIE